MKHPHPHAHSLSQTFPATHKVHADDDVAPLVGSTGVAGTASSSVGSSTTGGAAAPSFLQRLRAQATSVFKQNLTPSLLSLSLAVGFVCGLFPIPG